MEHYTKEYYKKQSEYWFNEASKFAKQRDMLIDDNAKLRKERDDLKRNIDEIVNYVDMKVNDNSKVYAYIAMKNKLDEILKEDE
ncbi:hypothetical protein [Staphylococcus felis]|uniref:Uncharacterized protein n=1 Tax=Staphylococcus felis TaxID=46127 RepID=A0A3E0IPJ4_9STAP|nr:hypothetical protein [Staphylococcus felis]REH94955.1 hypothetical protein DOS83_06935 [Staphylococcus felis]